MIAYMLEGHAYHHDIQTMIQVFYPNTQYKQVEHVPQEGIAVLSRLSGDSAYACFFLDGKPSGEMTIGVESENEKERKHRIKQCMYLLLRSITGYYPQWGMLTGIRPAKKANQWLDKGLSPEQVFSGLRTWYDLSEEKARLTLEVAQRERNILRSDNPNCVSIYIGIPFCPTRCLYCSFTSYPLKQYGNKVDGYLTALFQEIQYISQYIKKNRLEIESIYIGGGTPTSLNEEQLAGLLAYVQNKIPLEKSMEYTVEAGRPDTITEEKLRILKRYGVTRISINPQTMNEETLVAIGRQHTVEDIRRVFFQARQAGHENINMDIILGLPEEKPEQVRHTLEEIKKLDPDSLTVHTLAVKRASRLKEKFGDYTLTEAAQLEKMLDISYQGAKEMGMYPYYMYRQKNMIGNFENVGYCKEGKEGIYNVKIMEETQTILALGAGSTSKVVDRENNKIERIFNVKNVDEYMDRIDEMIERKRLGLPGGRIFEEE